MTVLKGILGMHLNPHVVLCCVMMACPSCQLWGESADNCLGYKWGTSIETIGNEYDLKRLRSAIYESNKKAWLADSVRPDFTLFVGGPPNDADTMIEDLRFQPTFGFFRGELIYVWLWGQERPFEKNELLELKDRLVERLFGSLRSKVNWIGIERTGPDDGTISGEGAYVGSVKDGSTISEFHICLGELERPMHLQFMFFQLDRRFFETLQESDYLLFPEDIRGALEAYRLFTWALPAKRIQIIRRLLTTRSDGSLLGDDTNRNTDTGPPNGDNHD